jgi:hypothetical protein
MRTAHLVPTESSAESPSDAADICSDGSRMPGSKWDRADATAAQRHAGSSSTRQRRAAMACAAVQGKEIEEEEEGEQSGGVGSIRWRGVFVGVGGESLQRLLLSCAISFVLVGPARVAPHGSDVFDFSVKTY